MDNAALSAAQISPKHAYPLPSARDGEEAAPENDEQSGAATAVMPTDLSHKPNVLYLASIERIATARRLVEAVPPDYVVAGYLAGLAVESILQAVALHGGAAHDARHSLPNWLSKCPSALNNALRGSAEWNELVALWDNGLRYLSFDGLLGYYRAKGYAGGKKGGTESRVRAVTMRLILDAQAVHTKGLAQWLRSTRR